MTWEGQVELLDDDSGAVKVAGRLQVNVRHEPHGRTDWSGRLQVDRDTFFNTSPYRLRLADGTEERVSVEPVMVNRGGYAHLSPLEGNLNEIFDS
jgi:hypothetical protein